MRLWKAHFTDAAGSKAVRKWQLLSRVLGTQGDPSRSLLGAEEVWLQVLRDALGDHLLQAEGPKAGSQKSRGGSPPPPGLLSPSKA